MRERAGEEEYGGDGDERLQAGAARCCAIAR